MSNDIEELKAANHLLRLMMDESQARVRHLEGVILEARSYANNPAATSWSGMLDILDDAYPERTAA